MHSLPEGGLPKFIWLSAAFSVFNTVQCMLQPLGMTRRIYSQQPQQVTPLSSHLFAAWTALSAILRYKCAFNMGNEVLFDITFWSYVIADRDDTFTNPMGALRVCIFFFGTNDATNETWHQHTPLDAYGDNLRYFASLLQSPSSEHYSPDTKIMFITPPPVGDRMVEANARVGNTPAVFTNESARKYADMVKTVAGEATIGT
ncbi:ergosterol biosynthesis protein [Coemansia sp. RSA 638]|nr:ergosterol biosynthesis protein [Coemansia sp. RSA 638]